MCVLAWFINFLSTLGVKCHKCNFVVTAVCDVNIVHIAIYGIWILRSMQPEDLVNVLHGSIKILKLLFF